MRAEYGWGASAEIHGCPSEHEEYTVQFIALTTEPKQRFIRLNAKSIQQATQALNEVGIPFESIERI